MAKETTASAYAMDSIQMSRHTMIAGVRVERNTWGSDRKIDQVTLRESPVKNGSSTRAGCPGFISARVGKNLILRGNYNAAMAAPAQPSTLGRSENINGNIAEGNPFLDRPSRTT